MRQHNLVTLPVLRHEVRRKRNLRPVTALRKHMLLKDMQYRVTLPGLTQNRGVMILGLVDAPRHRAEAALNGDFSLQSRGL